MLTVHLRRLFKLYLKTALRANKLSLAIVSTDEPSIARTVGHSQASKTVGEPSDNGTSNADAGTGGSENEPWRSSGDTTIQEQRAEHSPMEEEEGKYSLLYNLKREAPTDSG